MLRQTYLLYCFFLCISLWCKPKDSLHYYSLKGIDFSVGGVSSTMNENANINLLKAITPAEFKARYNYDHTTTKKSFVLNPIKIGLGIAFGNSQHKNRKFFNKNELIFKFSFESLRTNNQYENIKPMFYYNTDYTVTAGFDYTYQTQTLGIGYQLASKPILKNIALFVSVNGDFGMVTCKQIKNSLRYADLMSFNDIKNYNTSVIRGNAILGLKYNFSCDINFFLQAESGILHYGQGIGTSSTYGGASFGIRYKFLEDQDKLNYNSNGFW